MDVKVITASEPLITNVTDIRPLASVCPPVSVKVTASALVYVEVVTVNEPFITHVTDVGPLDSEAAAPRELLVRRLTANVSPSVCDEVGVLGECLIAHVADIRFQGGVCSCMDGEAASPSEPFVTDIADMRLVSSVNGFILGFFCWWVLTLIII